MAAAPVRSLEAMAAAAARCGMPVEPYQTARTYWPRAGRHILASFDDDSVVVYQAFNQEIAKYAVEHGRFTGCPVYLNRMTWIKTNFLWMQYRAGWGTKDKNQTNILRITLTREFFEQLLENALRKGGGKSCVRLQWDPDHHPCPPYSKQERRAIQLGLKGDWQEKLAAGVDGGCVRSIVDITEFVQAARPCASEDAAVLLTATERVYPVLSAVAREAVKVDEYVEPTADSATATEDESKGSTEDEAKSVACGSSAVVGEGASAPPPGGDAGEDATGEATCATADDAVTTPPACAAAAAAAPSVTRSTGVAPGADSRSTGVAPGADSTISME